MAAQICIVTYIVLFLKISKAKIIRKEHLIPFFSFIWDNIKVMLGDFGTPFTTLN